MSKHKYASLISEKLNNMDLCLFHKHLSWDSWKEIESRDFHLVIDDNFDYFLCEKDRRDSCFRWLNGEVAQYRINDELESEWSDIQEEREWKKDSLFVSNGVDIRIKPRTSDIFIGIMKGGTVCDRAFFLESDLTDYVKGNYPEEYSCTLEIKKIEGHGKCD